MKSEVADQLKAIHDRTPRSTIDDAAEVAVSIGQEILDVTREYAVTQGAPGGFNLSDMRYASFYTHEGTDALSRLQAKYPTVRPGALFWLFYRVEMRWRGEMIPTQGAGGPTGGSDWESDCAAFRSSFHYAALANNLPEILKRIAAGEGPDVRDAAGFTPLHFTAQNASMEAAAALLSHGAVVDAPNAFGNTPLHVAVYNCSSRGAIIPLLRRHGADPYMSNHNGLTPLALSRLITDKDFLAEHLADLP
jgi:uncharacterized protein